MYMYDYAGCHLCQLVLIQ